MTEWNRESLLQVAKKSGVKVASLIVEDRSNDPFYLVTAEASAKAKWFAEVYKTIMAKFPNIRPHLRRLHYAYSSLLHAERDNGSPYVNDDNSWSYLLDASKEARYNKLVGYDEFIDRRNPAPLINADFTTPHKEWDAPSKIAMTYQDIGTLHTLNFGVGYPEVSDAEELAESLAEAFTRDMTSEIKYNIQKLQPYHLEVWIEKSTMNEELEPICRRFDANFVYGLGQQSITQVNDLIQRILQSEKPTRIAYIADFDSQGNTMPETVARKIQFHNETDYDNELDIKMYHLALTVAQVEKYQLPKNPTRTPQASAGFEAKLNQEQLSVHRGRLEKYGDTLRKRQPFSVELDALATFHVGELERLLTDFLSCFYDPQLGAEVDSAIEDFKQEVYDEITEGVSANSSAITEAIEKINGHYTDINEQLSELHEKALKIKTEIAASGLYDKIVRLQNQHVNLEDLELVLPDPETNDDAFTGDWLYDSTLGYMEQTQRLREHRLRMCKDVTEDDP